jgi:dephospho-CoA kinase
MDGLVLAFSGGLGAGKSLLATALAERLGWPRVSFGDYVRTYASQVQRDPKDRAVLQQLGQALVLTDREGFVRKVLDQHPTTGNLIVEGVRHVEILLELKKQVFPRTLKLIHIKADSETRQARFMRREHVERRLVARYDSDITEAQVARILPQYADHMVDGSLPIPILADQVVGFMANWMGPPRQASA